MFRVTAHSTRSSTLNPFASSLNTSELQQMAMFIEALPFVSHVRLVNANQCILANLAYAKQLGFQKKEDVTEVTYSYIVNHRRHCIAALGGNLAEEADYQRFICNVNTEITHTKKPYHFQVCTLFPTGFVGIGNVHKIPLLEMSRNVSAILTIFQDVTGRFELTDLYAFYQKHYATNKQAISQFIKYLNLEHAFSSLPTHRELLTLLMFRKDARSKYVARQLALSNRTVEEYKSRLRHKLKHSISLESLLLKLRHLNHYTSEEVVSR